jgi:hypothetical protein
MPALRLGSAQKCPKTRLFIWTVTRKRVADLLLGSAQSNFGLAGEDLALETAGDAGGGWENVFTRYETRIESEDKAERGSTSFG